MAMHMIRLWWEETTCFQSDYDTQLMMAFLEL